MTFILSFEFQYDKKIINLKAFDHESLKHKEMFWMFKHMEALETTPVCSVDIMQRHHSSTHLLPFSAKVQLKCFKI